MALGIWCLNACCCHQLVTAVLPVRALSRAEKWSGEVCMLCPAPAPAWARHHQPVQWTRGRLERCLARCLAACVPLFQGTDRGMSQLSLQLHWQTSLRRQRRTYQRTFAHLVQCSSGSAGEELVFNGELPLQCLTRPSEELDQSKVHGTNIVILVVETLVVSWALIAK